MYGTVAVWNAVTAWPLGSVPPQGSAHAAPAGSAEEDFAPSTSAPVRLEDAGFFTSPATAPEAVCAGVGWGKFPATEARSVAGATPVTWKYDVERARPFAAGASAASSAPTATAFGSYAAKACWTHVGSAESLNFSGLSLSFAQSGFHAE